MKNRKFVWICFLFVVLIIVVALRKKDYFVGNSENPSTINDVGWQQIDSEWYYYDKSGNPVRNEWIDRYYIGEDGKMVRNQYVDRFFVSEDGSWNGRFEPPNWLMHGIWKKNGNTWTYQYNNITQFLDFSQIRSISRLGYDVYSEKTPPEQSEESYRLAVENGFTILLCDLCFTKDSVPVCFHDEYINRIARDENGQELENDIKIADLTYEEILKYDFGIYKGEQYKGTRILKLEEMLRLAQRLNTELYIEIKSGTKSEIGKAVNLSKQFGLKISWAGTTYEECLAVVEADNTARISTMPRIIRDIEIQELLSLKRENNEVFFFTYDTAILTDEVLNKLRDERIPFEMETIDSEVEIVNYLTENYQYCTGIESNRIVASKIDMDQVMKG